MHPLSQHTRRTYFVLLVVAFFIVIPVAILYATGYRLIDFSFAQTGGVYVTMPAPDITVSMNGKGVGTSGIFDRTVYIDNLSPGTFVVQAEKADYYSWSKVLTVEPWKVTDVRAIMVPTSIPIREVFLATTTEAVATSTTVAVSRAGYDAILKAFATTTPVQTSGDIGLFLEKGDVVVRWMRGLESAPSSFCSQPSFCVTQFKIEKGADVVTEAQFFASGVTYRTSSGIYFTDIDIRSPQMLIPLYQRAGTNSRVVNGALIIKDGKSFYRIDAW